MTPRLKASEHRQIQIERLRAALSKMDTGPLLELFKEQAEIHFGGFFAIFYLGTHFKAAFGVLGFDVEGRGDVEDLPAFATLKEAVIDAMATVRTFWQEADRDAIRAALVAKLETETA